MAGLNKLTKQLRREVTANPKKAAVLGLLAAVALWFWAPLVWGLVASDGEKTAKAVESNTDTPPSIPVGYTEKSKTTQQKTDEPQHSWQQVVEWMEDDPLTSTANVILKQLGPFQTPEPKVVEETVEPEIEPEIVQKDLTPEELGLVLSSTIIGTRRRLAQISGKTFELGRLVNVTKDDRRYEFRLVEVQHRMVVLQRNSERFELRIPAPVDSEKIELYGRK
jgi:hypothetical protein